MQRFPLRSVVSTTGVIRRAYHPSNSQSGIMDSISKAISKFGANSTIYTALRLFQSCQAQAANTLWHSKGEVGNDFRSKHMLLVLHVWMIHRRLLKEGKPGLLVQEALFDELWENTCNRIRAVGVNELSVNKYLKEVQGYSFRCCVELDHALASNLEDIAEDSVHPEANQEIKRIQLEQSSMDAVEREKKIMEDIASSLWRTVYLRREDVKDERVFELAKYIRNEQQSLLKIPKEAIFEGRIEWGQLPWAPDATETARAKSIWREAMANDGRIYYWNIETRESQWEKPEGDNVEVQTSASKEKETTPKSTPELA